MDDASDSNTGPLQAGSPVDLGSPDPQPLAPPKTVKYDPAKARETMRGRIAMWLIYLLCGMNFISLLIIWIHPDRSKELHEFLTLTFGPVIALVGSATGFYFGSRDLASKGADEQSSR